MIKIIATMKVKQECLEEFKSLSRELVEKSRAEEGNISYSLNEKIGDPCTMAYIEIWKDREAIEAHKKSEHFRRIVKQTGKLCEGSSPIMLFHEVEF